MGVRECRGDSLASAKATVSRGLDCAAWSVDSTWLSGCSTAPPSRPQSAQSSRPQSAQSSRPQSASRRPSAGRVLTSCPLDIGSASTPLPVQPSGPPPVRHRPRSAPSGGRAAQAARPQTPQVQGWPYMACKDATLAGPGHAAARRARKPKDDPLHPGKPRGASDTRGGRPPLPAPPVVESLLDRVWRLWSSPEGAVGPEMSIKNFMFILAKSGFFSGPLADSAARSYLEALTRSKEVAVLVVKTHERYSRGVSYIQFAGALQEFAGVLGITYSECVSKLVNAETAITKLKILFRNLSTSARCGQMTVSDFSKFCERFELFVERKFCHADIHIMLCKSSDKRKVDYDEFLSMLAKIAGMLGIDWDIFSSALVVRGSELGFFAARQSR